MSDSDFRAVSKVFSRIGINPRIVGILALLIFLWFFLSIYAGDRFYGLNNVENLLKRTGLYGILGIGVAFVIITSGIDLSIGSLVCLMACLLSIFLQVDYAPTTRAPVAEVQAADKTIVLRDSTEGFAPGDPVRFSGGNHAASSIKTIASLDQVGSGGAISIVVDTEFNRDDDTGIVDRLTKIESLTRADVEDKDGRAVVQLTITLVGSHALRPRDQIDFMLPPAADAARSDYTDLATQAIITDVDTEGGNTRVTIKSDIPKLTEAWLALPKLRRQRMSIPMALGLLLAIALALGVLHGVLVTKLSLPPFVVTLCGLLIYRGVSRSIMQDQPGGFGNEYESFQQLGAGKLVLWESASGTSSFGLPYPFLVMVIFGLTAAVFLNRTVWGRYLLAIGRNEEAARYSGINTSRMIIMAYVIGVLASTIGGVLFALYANSVPPSSFGAWYELYAIAAAVLGGCSLRGGEGSIFGVIVGAALMQTLYNLIQMLSIPGFNADQIEQAVIGAVILAGVSADEIVRRIVAARRARPIDRSRSGDGGGSPSGDASSAD
ncbi:MAG: hypothetical protein DWQ31_21145 [Planctomycetota bacterium]|nr:MAG: hypothetical protein DWQ31_21145 [Planctomycetota bacterium]REJ91206.1 MAG: hypothetical protein DWQ35_15080 [Planctomycetota bacterium]REK22207.1 MAG: hypothetical protein DWQ42_17785 [Planctomycetota bacterium]REK44271.1 MAG: hypothetical protein DWQ46_10270 [Planctomycetota bacterium]